ncbi:MAG TPA: YceI family protein [Acidimicrobiia bacterium]|jgi:polyisoprenoid-binding protein YceI|nr:YceI family protein [Acidimicrobiia bacterium]
MTAVQSAPAITGYIPGTWAIDTAHSEIGFSVRHLMVSKVKGAFRDFSGTFVTAENPFDSSVEASVVLSSVDTGNADRDAHLRSADFFDTEQHTLLTYRSTGIRYDDEEGFVVDGELTLRGVTKQVPLQLEIHGFQQATPFGDTRTGFTATGEIDRRDFGVSFNMALEGGGVGLGNKVQITLEIEAVLQPAPAEQAS